jgi:hypothetical protein
MELPCPECGEPVILNSGYYGILVEELAHACRIADKVQRKIRRSSTHHPMVFQGFSDHVVAPMLGT